MKFSEICLHFGSIRMENGIVFFHKIAIVCSVDQNPNKIKVWSKHLCLDFLVSHLYELVEGTIGFPYL